MTIIIELEISGPDTQNVEDLVDNMLDGGTIQDEILAAASDVGIDLEIESATVRAVP